MDRYQWFVSSPIGELLLVGTETHLCSIGWKDSADTGLTVKGTLVLRSAEEQLAEYFSEKRTSFSIPLAPAGTEFQKKVWRALETIPYGITKSYSDIASLIGNPKACRAVGLANSKNPIPIIVPCHRVIGKGGELVGFAGGIPTKRFLLELENALPKKVDCNVVLNFYPDPRSRFNF